MSVPTPETPTMDRRRFCAVAATAAAAGAGVATIPRARAQSDGGLEAWFGDVSNYDGVADATGRSEVRVGVGVPTAAGPYGFGPAAVRVDPGTTVVWEWTGEGGVHDVSATDGSFGSDLRQGAGATFEQTFEAEGVYRYVCTPHEALGMKGAVVVGDVAVGEAGGDAAAGEPDYGDWFDDVGNYEGTVDARGRSDVTVQVGATVDGVPFGFEPPAVRVSPGTTVTWEWTGEGGAHDVTAEEGTFGSDLTAEAGHTFTHAFESDGIHRYVCTPHEALGMKGAVVVGDAAAPARSDDEMEAVLVGGVGGLIMAALFLIPIAELSKGRRRHGHARRGA